MGLLGLDARHDREHDAFLVDARVAIRCDDVSFSYDDQGEVLHNVDLSIEEGEYVCIIGANGSGKSTLIRLIDGLLKPTSGSITVFGRPALDPDEAASFAVRRDVGIVFQNPDEQMVMTIVEEEVAFGPQNLGIDSELLPDIVARSLRAVGLSGFEKREVSTLSGGQKQRLCLAGVLACDPRVIICDESLSMLDPEGRDEIQCILEDLHREGATILLISQLLDVALRAQRCIVMNEGRIVSDGSPRQILASELDKDRSNPLIPSVFRFGMNLKRAGIPVGFPASLEEMEEELCRLFSKK